jgi:hypothetical protein
LSSRCSTNITKCRTITSLLVSFGCGFPSLREEYRLRVFKSRNTSRFEVGKPEGNRTLGRKTKINIKHILKIQEGSSWTRKIWLRIGANVGPLSTS